MPPHSARAAGRTILPAGLLGLGKYYRNLFGGSNILREFDTGCAVAPERGPEPQDHATSLEEADLLVRLLCAAPAHRLIQGSGPGQIADANGYQTDALLHLAASQSTTNCVATCTQPLPGAFCIPTGIRASAVRPQLAAGEWHSETVAARRFCVSNRPRRSHSSKD
jgi:hypothetical protein